MIVIKKILNISFLFCIFIGAIVHFRSSWHSIWRELLQTSSFEILALLLITILYFTFDSMIIHTMITQYQEQITFKECLFCSFYCTFLGIATMGSGAGIGEIYYFHNKGIETSVASSLCIIKYIIKKIIIAAYGLLAFIVLSLFIPNLLREYQIYVYVGILITLATIILLFSFLTWSWFTDKIMIFLKKISLYERLSKKTNFYEQEIKTFQSESKKILKNHKIMFPICFLYLCKLICLYIFPLYHFLTIVNTESYFPIILIMAVCNMLAGIIPTPYGFGSLEFTCLLLYGQMIAEPKIISMLLLFRFFTDVFPLLMGGLCFLQYKRNKEFLSHKKQIPLPHLLTIKKKK